ncbi:fumarylacetoacetate hydrolase [Sphingobium sp. AP50]|uniref:fumarylacetoacetase n=1 Tax=Sphingobium sp. AP50 TaxID=1884369 RepID=UPI0008B069CE|nr:fumarylacetoacetase [Sphingobium sp. AP50]SEJ90375.1 fumarylacetoacetate hydrolase [Sphingobium sp. AP50]
MTISDINETHDAARTSWVDSAQGHADFPIQNLPLGVFSVGGDQPRGGVAIGDQIVDLAALSALGVLEGLAQEAAVTASTGTLNALLAMGPEPRAALRFALSALLSDADQRASVEPVLVAQADATMHLPVTIGDYTDFYVGINHATNIGKLLRPDNPLAPNYKYVPIGYHGRASSVCPSGARVIRPTGQRKGPDDAEPSVGPSRRLDYELELGVWVGEGNALGEPIPIGRAGKHVAGLSIFNDWSARDLQAWEYQPLGPFLSKSFISTVTPWIVTAEALAPYRVAQPPRPEGDPKPLDYLWDEADQAHGAFALTLEVFIETAQMREKGIAPHKLSSGPATSMYWTVAQMVAHHTSNGCNMRPGDLLGTGTISGPDNASFGSLMEISQAGKHAFTLETGETRTFLEAGDRITIRATASAEGYASIGFGSCVGTVEERPSA